MDAKQTVQLAAYNAVISQFRQPADAQAIATIPALKSAMELFTATLAGTAGTTLASQEGSEPESLTKAEAKQNLADITAGIAAQLFSWASQNEDIALKEQTDLSAPALFRLKDALLPDQAKSIYDLATAHKDQLVPFGLTDGLLVTLTDAIDDFKTIVASPRNKIARRSADSKKMNAALVAARTIMKEQIRKLMPQLSKTYPEVYNRFLVNSKIADGPSASAKSKAAKSATKTDKPSGAPQP